MKLPEAKKGFGIWPERFAGCQFLTFAILMLSRVAELMAQRTSHALDQRGRDLSAVSTELTTDQMFINGAWIDAAVGQSFESLNPYTGQPWATIPDGQEPDVDRAVEAARKALDNPN